MDPASPGGSHSQSNNSDHSSEKRRSKPFNTSPEAAVPTGNKTPAIVTDHEIPNGDGMDNMNFLEGTDMKMHCLLKNTDDHNNDVHLQNNEKVRILVKLTTVK